MGRLFWPYELTWTNLHIIFYVKICKNFVKIINAKWYKSLLLSLPCSLNSQNSNQWSIVMLITNLMCVQLVVDILPKQMTTFCWDCYRSVGVAAQRVCIGDSSIGHEIVDGYSFIIQSVLFNVFASVTRQLVTKLGTAIRYSFSRCCCSTCLHRWLVNWSRSCGRRFVHHSVGAVQHVVSVTYQFVTKLWTAAIRLSFSQCCSTYFVSRTR